MDDLSHFTESAVKNLPPLPSQSSHIPAGRYPVESTLLDRIRAVKLFAESHDQGFASDISAGNWTWFELAILENDAATAPKVTKDGVELVWTSHPNRIKSSKYGWEAGGTFSSERDLLNFLEARNVIAVRICARFLGWKIFAANGYLLFDISDREVNRRSIKYGPIIDRITTIDETLQRVNKDMGVGLLPPISPAVKTANVIEKGGNEPPLRVLSFDGGGVRGMSSLYLLKAVMDRAYPDKKPCDVFDMIGGTSAGGLIAIMLGRLRMNVQQCIDAYDEFMKDVFDHWKITQWTKVAFTGTFYDDAPLVNAVKKILRNQGMKEDEPLLEENESLLGEVQAHRCKVFVMAVQSKAANNREPMFLRSYQNPLKESEIPNIKIWEAARATSAAPYYFKPIQVGRYELVDGGLGANNPLGWLWTEVLGVYGASRKTQSFLSIGTGIPANTPVSITNFASIATNSEITHSLFHSLINAFAPEPLAKKYWRLNVAETDWVEEKCFWAVKWGKVEHHEVDNFRDPGELDDLEALKRFIVATEKYIADNAKLFDECAEGLKNVA
ncbi:Calcium-independent phospholipase A2-gamma [Lasiodiplodia hormozganensis]|uniref:Calcium-independent phospholipase A2-gamma n=1 Tax=Lasiodiplodia hormozganensis TaxID=869390 RepID=A0AA39XTZ9_9PEZI|nr:Calcium-independent phospholipase A2-gamma [Lasiodiplodia hormozganensis]